MRIFLIVVFFLPLLLKAQKILFKKVNIVDVQKGKVIANQNVFVEGNRIKRISSKPFAVKGATVVNGTGKYLIPGLWDMHTHTDAFDNFEQRGLPLFIANGVTGIREMGSGDYNWKRWRNSTSVQSPRIVACGKILDGARNHGLVPERITVTNPIDAEIAIDSIEALGADFIKIHDWLSEEAFMQLCKKQKQKS
ncbi:MAG: amidohydrolase family protein [Chitinophagaceae bacterium]